MIHFLAWLVHELFDVPPHDVASMIEQRRKLKAEYEAAIESEAANG